MTKKQKKVLARILTTAASLLFLSFLPLHPTLRLALYLAVYWLIGSDILKKAALGVRNRQIFDENFLMAVATVGAFALAIWQRSGDYTEAIAVMLFYQLGELFQSVAVGKSRKSIAALMDIRPDYANIERDGQLLRVNPDEIAVGDEILVQPGEKIPLDGVVLSGVSTLNTAALTGESLPRDVAEGDSVISGCVNLTGLLRVRATKVFSDSTVNKILELVEDSGTRKSRSENFISRFARVYTPAVCFLALALAILPPLAALVLGKSPLWSVWIYRALTFLVISCPCALVISIPLTFFAGIGGASRRGVLVKGSSFLESLSRVKTIAFDKTGTLTQGVFEVTAIHQATMPEVKLLEYAAHAECASSHPISKSLRRAWEERVNQAEPTGDRTGTGVDRERVREIREIPGKGVSALVDSKQILAGNAEFLAENGISVPSCPCVGTRIFIAIDGVYEGHILISDVLKSTAPDAVSALRAQGIQTVMLTGDSPDSARQIAQRVGVDTWRANLLPADKVTAVEGLLSGGAGRDKVAFVGDGINDAPVLTRADIGIAMGALGSDAAIEAADVVLMDDDPMKISTAIAISKKCLAIVYENIVFSLLVKFGCLALVALGKASMWAGIFADVGVMVLAVLNAVRALSIREK